MAKGKLIVIEAGDGCGKATQTKVLFARLQAEGFSVKKIEFPDYDSPAAMPVKMYLGGEFGSTADEVNAYAASTFFAVDRFASYRKKWGRDYEDGTVILADRYTTSNLVHQAVKITDEKEREAYFDWLTDFEYGKLGLPAPDEVIFLDMKPEVSAKLIAQRAEAGREKDIHEQDEAYLVRCHEAYAALAKREGWKTVSCDDGEKPRSIEEISEEIYSIVKGILA